MRFKDLSRSFNFLVSSLEIFRDGIFAILEIVSSISFSVIIFLPFGGVNLFAAPVSSITTIALSGNFLSFIYLEDNSTAQLIESSEYLNP